MTQLPKSLPPSQPDAYLAAIIESSDDAIISKNLNGFITSWNKSAERIFGYTADEAVGRHITLIIPSERLPEEDKILSTLKSGQRVDHFETLRRNKSGELIPISITVSPIRNAEGTIIGASKIARDISDRFRAEEALRQANMKEDEFLANISHELRTPMNAVVGLTSLLKAMPHFPAQAMKFIDTLKISADNMMDLINDLLDFAKIESDSLQFETVEFNLSEQIEKAISLANVKVREKGLTLYVHCPESLNHYYIGDPLRIHQVLMNLLSNATKFTIKGSIDVDITGIVDKEADTTEITFKISDTGIGIAQDKLESIFDKFTQADASITRRYGGSGLGLAITKGLVEKMGGSISVFSEQGAGSTFTFSLPLKNSSRRSIVESFSVNAAPTIEARNRNVLLVEDYEPNVLVAGSMLEQFGFDYDVAHNGFDALRKFVHGRYDVILMDVQMHDLDGLEATRRIRRMETDKSLPRTPIIAVTAHAREQDRKSCLEAGMDDFIAKPFVPANLLQTLLRYIEQEITPSNDQQTQPDRRQADRRNG